MKVLCVILSVLFPDRKQFVKALMAEFSPQIMGESGQLVMLKVYK